MSRAALLGLLAAATPAAAAPVVPGPAKIVVSVRAPRQLLGDHVLLDFCVVNTGRAAIRIDVGGDYRGSSRSLRFKVEVRDAHGAVMPDPDPAPFNLGGLGCAPEIAPGKRWCQSLPLARYARIERPGRYTITATHDLGWPAGRAPTGKVRLGLAMPTAAQAERVVAAMDALPDDPGTSAGELSRPYADFTTLAYPPYVAPLVRRAQQGNLRAITGLAYNPTVDATRALVALLDHKGGKVARAAAEALALRLPDPALAGQLGPRNPFEDARAAQRKYLGRAWLPALANDVRAAAHRRLASVEIDDQRAGAFMLEAVGTAADAPALVKALDVAIDRTRTVPAETAIYPVPRGAAMELLRAAAIVIARGARPPANPRRPGELALWLVALDKGARPAGWQRVLAAAMRHPIAYVRELALAHAPDQLAPALQAAAAADLADADPDVQVAAAELARRAHLVALAPAVVKAMRRLTGIRLNIVSAAAYQLGARYDRARMLVSRLGDPAAFDQALAELVDLLRYTGRSSSGQVTPAMRATVVAAWRRFVAAHRADIEAGRKLPLTDPSVTRDLVPPTWKLGRPTGGQWP